jgi:hypothetical protein
VRVVHGRWVELTRKAARGPVVTRVPTVGQFLHRWLDETVAPNLAPLTYATYESHVKNYIEPGVGALRLDRLRVADVQAWLNRLPAQCQCCAQERTSDGRSAARHGAARSGGAATTAECRAERKTVLTSFTGRYGTPVDPRTLNRKFTARCDAAGVRRLTVHDARHTCATLLVDLDVHPRVIMRILRHADQAVTMEIYANASSAATREALRRLGDILH